MSLANIFSKYFRDKKWQLFLKIFSLNSNLKILDIGYQNQEYQVADNYLEKHYPYPERITALGIEDAPLFKKRYPRVAVVKYDGQNFPFNEQEFDIAWSNATLEHVGDYQKQLQFLKEIKRCAQAVFLTTPNRYFPLEIHTRLPFLHWLPKKYFDFVAKKMGKGWATGDYMYLLSLKDLRQLLTVAGFDNYEIIHQRCLGFTLQFIVIVK